jgi:UDP-N-acetylmuramate dehydrogenase
VEQNLGGIENLALIPGNCGAAPIQNIGAYGRELADVLECVDTIDLRSGITRRFNAQECQLGYRNSIFKQPEGKFFFISSITLRLSTENHLIESSYGALQSILKSIPAEEQTISDVYKAVVEIRKAKLPDPQVTGNAGSFFKNPVISLERLNALKSMYSDIPSYNTDNQHFKIPAAWLIEKAGWKGKQKGPVGIHKFQALVIINSGGASGKQILDFSEEVKRDVQTKFGVTLEREVNAV